MAILVVSGTGTEIGKTITTAAVAALALAAGRSVAVLKPAQTGVAPGEPGDVFEVRRLAGEAVTGVELARFPEPLAPNTSARRAGMAPIGPQEVAEAAVKLAAEHDLVLVEGAGGLLVRFDDEGGTLADAARLLGAPVLVVTPAGLGTLNSTALTGEALRARDLEFAGVVVGGWRPSRIWPRDAISRTFPRRPGHPCSALCPRAPDGWRPPTSVPERPVGSPRRSAAFGVSDGCFTGPPRAARRGLRRPGAARPLLGRAARRAPRGARLLVGVRRSAGRAAPRLPART